jgi:hypothetical protein
MIHGCGGSGDLLNRPARCWPGILLMSLDDMLELAWL